MANTEIQLHLFAARVELLLAVLLIALLKFVGVVLDFTPCNRSGALLTTPSSLPSGTLFQSVLSAQMKKAFSVLHLLLMELEFLRL